MKRLFLLLYFVLPMNSYAQNNSEKFQSLSFGSIKPSGWLRDQMQKDMGGFVGNLDLIVPELINDAIYGKGRLRKNSPIKDLGNLKSGDTGGDEQYQWWNSETQSNWWDGYIRNALLLSDTKGIQKIKKYVANILETQDEDGYIGIYDPDLRYNFESENGELWSKATLYRGLLAYYEYSQNKMVFEAVEKAVENVMQNYPRDLSSPFNSGKAFNGGVSHGLTFTDVLERLYYHTKNEKYRQYALFLYKDFSNTFQTEEDAQLPNILNPHYQLKSHGVHAFEHIRALVIAKYSSQNLELGEALNIYLKRINDATTLSGGAIGDEWIAQRKADATNTGYEYCSLQELLDSYCLYFQKSGIAGIGDKIENLFYNAAQGSRNPHHSCIAYLKTDNSFEMLGTKNGSIEPERKQTRYKYSPAHQDVAVCCNPNAGRISPYFVQNSWFKENDTTLVAALLLPNVLQTDLNGRALTIANRTNYPFENKFTFKISQAQSSTFAIKIRIPEWVKRVVTKEKYEVKEGFMVVTREFKANDTVEVSFDAEVCIKSDPIGSRYFVYGALLYALPIQAKEISGKTYRGNFTDYMYEPLSRDTYSFKKGCRLIYEDGEIRTELLNANTQQLQEAVLIPFGKTILRQVTF